MEITKAKLAQEVIEYLISEGLIKYSAIDNYSDAILGIQDIFSKYWDEEEI